MPKQGKGGRAKSGVGTGPAGSVAAAVVPPVPPVPGTVATDPAQRTDDPSAPDTSAPAPPAPPAAPPAPPLEVQVVRARLVSGTVAVRSTFEREFVPSGLEELERPVLSIEDTDDGDSRDERVISVGIGDLEFFPSVLVEPGQVKGAAKGVAHLIGVARGPFLTAGRVVAVPFPLPELTARLGEVARSLLSIRSSGVKCPIWSQRWSLSAECLATGMHGPSRRVSVKIAPAGIGEEVAARQDLDALRQTHRDLLDALNEGRILFRY